MKAALSIVLAGLLVTTPVKLVLAQAAEQDSTTADASLVQAPESSHLIRVPALTATTALLWQPALENHSVQEASWDWPKGVKVVLIVILSIGLAVLLYFLLKEAAAEVGEFCPAPCG